MVPVAMIELNEAGAAFGEAAGEEAIAGEGAGLVHVLAIELRHGLGFSRQIHEFRHARLHAIRHLVLANARFDLRIARLRELEAIEISDAVEHEAALVPAES